MFDLYDTILALINEKIKEICLIATFNSAILNDESGHKYGISERSQTNSISSRNFETETFEYKSYPLLFFDFGDKEEKAIISRHNIRNMQATNFSDENILTYSKIQYESGLDEHLMLRVPILNIRGQLYRFQFVIINGQFYGVETALVDILERSNTIKPISINLDERTGSLTRNSFCVGYGNHTYTLEDDFQCYQYPKVFPASNFSQQFLLPKYKRKGRQFSKEYRILESKNAELVKELYIHMLNLIIKVLEAGIIQINEVCQLLRANGYKIEDIVVPDGIDFKTEVKSVEESGKIFRLGSAKIAQ